MAENKSFEESIKRLEEIVKLLDNGDTPLEQSISLFEEGVALSGYCNKLLQTANQKVVMLTQNKNGEMAEEEFKGMEE